MILNMIKYTWHAHKTHFSVPSYTDNLIFNEDLSHLQHNVILNDKISLCAVFQNTQVPAVCYLNWVHLQHNINYFV